MARQSARGADDDRARHFDVTADASGEFVVRAVAAPECAHHASSDMPRAGHEVPPRTPPDLAFLPAHVSIGRAEDCDAHLRALLGTLRRLGPAGWRVERQAPRDEKKKQASPEDRVEENALGRDGARSRVERLERVSETERVPETEFPCMVRCSLPALSPGGKTEEETREAPRSNAAFADALPDVPSIPLDDPLDEPRDWMNPATSRVPETLFEAGDEGRLDRARPGGEETAGPPGAGPAASPGPSDAAATPAASTRSRRRSREAGEKAAKTPWKTPTVRGARWFTTQTQQTTPYTEPRLTEDGVFSPAPETVARATATGTATRGALARGFPGVGVGGSGRFGAHGELIFDASPMPSHERKDEMNHDAYFADLHRRQQSGRAAERVGGPLMNPRGSRAAGAAARRGNAFTYPSPAAATPATAPRGRNDGPPCIAHPGRSPLAPLPFPDSDADLAATDRRSLPLGAPRSVVVGNLTARDLVAMPTRGGVTIRTAAEAEAEAEVDRPRRTEGGGALEHDDPCSVAGDDAGNAAAAPETVMVPDTFAVDDAREPFASGFAFHGGSEDPEAVPSPAAMAVDRAPPGPPSKGGSADPKDPKTPKTGGFGGFAGGGGFDDTAGKPAASRFLDDSAAKAKAPPSAFGGFGSFSTGNGKAVEVSAEAMSKAAAIFDGGERQKLAAVAPARFVSPAASPAPAPRPAAAAPAHAPRRAAAAKSAGFQSPMLAGAPRQALGKRRLDVDAAAAVSASRFQKQKTGRAGISGAPSVHDLFASRGARREGYAAFFGGLRPSERPPSRHAPHGSARLGFVSSDLAAGLRVADAEGRALGARELRRRMLAAGCVARLLDADWVQNAYRWVVWHHACVVRSFPETLTDGLLTASAVEQRLLYRYQRETLGASRPFLRRVWERDAPASAPAVLVVAAIRRMPFLRNDELVQNDAQNDDAFANGAELELSDGWYGAPARCDAATTRLVRSGVLRVGAKILTQGLELMPKDGEPASPLADEALDNWLALRRNQVRPVPWDAKLGARPGSATAFSLRSIEADGGAVKKVLLFVERVYPSTWMESDRPDGKRVHRSELAETRAARAWEQARAAALERLADALARERATRGIDDGAAEARARAELERRGLFERRTRRAARFRVSGVRSTRKGGLPLPIGLERSTGSALLTVYDLDEDAAARLATSEGATFEVTDVVARLEKKEGGLELIASRRSRWRRVTPSVLARANLEPKPTPRRLATVRDLADDDVSRDVARDVARDGARGVRFGEEFDCVAAIVRVARATPVGAPASQWVFLADASVGSGFGSGFGTRAADFELLAVETRVAHAEAFVDAEAWGAGTGFETRGEGVGEKKGDARGGDGGSFAVVPVALENLTYVRRDAANGVRVAAFTERSRATPMFESGDARETRYAKQKRETPFGSGPNAPLAARQARALRRGLGEGSDAATARLRDALLARVRALTGSASPPSASEPEPRSGFDAERVATNGDAASKANREGGFGFASEPGRRKRSLSLGSEAEWGASQLAHIEAVEAKALEARRSRKCAETQ
jgi:hypothetical protein